jgi:hypothetical protein
MRRGVPVGEKEVTMRTCLMLMVGALLAGCAAGPSEAEPGAVPLTWTGDFKGGRSSPGHVTLLLDETGDAWRGTMYFETLEPFGTGAPTARVTYRIEGSRVGNAVQVRQAEILEADPLSNGYSWCMGTYDLALADGDAQALSGPYSETLYGCSGVASLSPASL